jgi:hypothetical protein
VHHVMAKPEQRLSNTLRHNLRLGQDLLVKHVEHLYEPGWPDTLVLAKRTRQVTWLEYKVANYPQREGGRIQFSHKPTVDQINWHLEWNTWGGRSFFLIRIEDSLFAVPGFIGDNVLSLNAASIAPYRMTHQALRDLCENG